MIGMGMGLRMGSRGGGNAAVAYYTANGFKPNLVADFAGASGSEAYVIDGAASDFDTLSPSFARAGTATYFDSDGVLQTAASGVPRRNAYRYNGTAWVNGGLLLESEARTNLLPYSSDLTSWTLNNQCGVTSDSGVGPDGVSSLDLITDDGLGGFSGNVYVQQTGLTVTASSRVSAQGFARIGNNDTFEIRTANDDAARGGTFDLTNETFTAMGSESGDVVNLGGGLYFVWTSWTTGADTYIALRVGFPSITRDGTNSFYFGFAQFESGSPSSHIPTSGSTVTRPAETLPLAAANLPYSSSAMSIAMKGRKTYADNNDAFEVRLYQWQSDASNYIDALNQTDGIDTGAIRWRQAEAGTVDNVNNEGGAEYSPGVNVPFAIASRHGSTFINGAVDGTALTEDTTPTALPDLSATDLDLGNDFMGFIESFVMWGEDIADAGIEAAST